MTQLESIKSQNEEYAKSFKHGDLSLPPSKKVVVLACMDARLNVNELLGLRLGEADIIRNAGGIVTEDAIRSLIISHELLGTEEFIVINHTDCGMLTFSDQRSTKENLGEIQFRIFRHSISYIYRFRRECKKAITQNSEQSIPC